MYDNNQQNNTKPAQRKSFGLKKLHHDESGAIGGIIYLIFAVLIGLLIVRVIFELLGANGSSQFASFVYGLTGPFVAPFNGIFNVPQTLGVAHIDVPAIIAIVVYGVVASVLGMITRRRSTI